MYVPIQQLRVPAVPIRTPLPHTAAQCEPSGTVPTSNIPTHPTSVDIETIGEISLKGYLLSPD